MVKFGLKIQDFVSKVVLTELVQPSVLREKDMMLHTYMWTFFAVDFVESPKKRTKKKSTFRLDYQSISSITKVIEKLTIDCFHEFR